MGSIEELLKQELGTSTLHNTGLGGGGCINEGTRFDTDSGPIFVKFNKKSEV